MRCFYTWLFNDDCILLNILLKNIHSLSVVLLFLFDFLLFVQIKIFIVPSFL